MITEVCTSHFSWHSLLSLVFDMCIYKKFKWGQENGYEHKHVKTIPPMITEGLLLFSLNMKQNNKNQTFHLRLSLVRKKFLRSSVRDCKGIQHCRWFERLFGCQWTVPKRTFLHLNRLPGINNL